MKYERFEYRIVNVKNSKIWKIQKFENPKMWKCENPKMWKSKNLKILEELEFKNFKSL